MVAEVIGVVIVYFRSAVHSFDVSFEYYATQNWLKGGG
jgi:hypothetical protein